MHDRTGLVNQRHPSLMCAAIYRSTWVTGHVDNCSSCCSTNMPSMPQKWSDNRYRKALKFICEFSTYVHINTQRPFKKQQIQAYKRSLRNISCEIKRETSDQAQLQYLHLLWSCFTTSSSSTRSSQTENYNCRRKERHKLRNPPQEPPYIPNMKHPCGYTTCGWYTRVL